MQISFGERSVEDDIQGGAPEDRYPIHEAMGATLESIPRQTEEGARKVQPPRPRAPSRPRARHDVWGRLRTVRCATPRGPEYNHSGARDIIDERLRVVHL